MSAVATLEAVDVVAEITVRDQALARLKELREDYVELAKRGRYYDAAGKEWAGLPENMRAVLLLMAGVHAGRAMELSSRGWRELPQEERSGVRFATRHSKRHLAGLRALASED